MDQSFGKQHRLRRRSDFRRLFSHQNKAAGKHVVVLVSRHGQRYRGSGRLGIVVSVKVSKSAARRHQLKRWVRELFRTSLKQSLHGMDLVILFRRDPPADAHRELDQEIRDLLPRAIKAAASYKQRRTRVP